MKRQLYYVTVYNVYTIYTVYTIHYVAYLKLIQCYKSVIRAVSDCPGGPVVKNLHANARRHRFEELVTFIHCWPPDTKS